jgi:hypothetical protein
VIRGRKVREKIADFLRRRRNFFIQREKEMPQRLSLVYRTRDYIGWAPSLKGDTNKEKVLRVFPDWLRPTVTECVERKWGILSELLKPPYIGDDSPSPETVTTAYGVASLLRLWNAKFFLFLAQRDEIHKAKLHEQARKRYREVCVYRTVHTLCMACMCVKYVFKHRCVHFYRCL